VIHGDIKPDNAGVIGENIELFDWDISTTPG
jgi:hypothetical protein